MYYLGLEPCRKLQVRGPVPSSWKKETGTKTLFHRMILTPRATWLLHAFSPVPVINFNAQYIVHKSSYRTQRVEAVVTKVLPVQYNIYTDMLRWHTRDFVYNPVGFHRWRWFSDSLTKACRKSGQYPTGYQTSNRCGDRSRVYKCMWYQIKTAAESTSPS